MILNIFTNIFDFVKSIFSAIQNLYQFILNLGNWISHLFSNTASMIGYLVSATSEVADLILTIPLFLRVFATAFITVMVAYKILGRD